MRKWDFLIVARKDNEGFVSMTTDESGLGALDAILQSSFRNGNEDVKKFILGVAENWLKEREVETRNFIEKIK